MGSVTMECTLDKVKLSDIETTRLRQYENQQNINVIEVGRDHLVDIECTHPMSGQARLSNHLINKPWDLDNKVGFLSRKTWWNFVVVNFSLHFQKISKKFILTVLFFNSSSKKFCTNFWINKNKKHPECWQIWIKCNKKCYIILLI